LDGGDGARAGELPAAAIRHNTPVSIEFSALVHAWPSTVGRPLTLESLGRD
jgi:hypothetical protein